MKRDDRAMRSALAGEYVLGTLFGRARRRFERLLADDATLREQVQRWEDCLYRLIDLLPERAPPQQVWQRIEADIDAADAEHGVMRHYQPAESRRWWPGALLASLNFWRGWSLAATTVAGVLAFALFARPVTEPVTYVVVVTDDARSRASWVLSGKAGSPRVQVRTLAPQALPADRAFQLWVLPAGESVVRSVGLIPATGDTQLSVDLPIAKLLGAAQKFGVSIEPPGGSPTGQPTTKPLYHGNPLTL